MNRLEKICVHFRHAPGLNRAAWLWDLIRPAYDEVLRITSPNGLERVMNGTHRMRVSSRFRGVPEIYEPQLWSRIMSVAEPGSIVVDVGAHIGLYTVAMAQQVGRQGRVFAFEPDPVNVTVLREHIRLNHVDDRVTVIQAAAWDASGTVCFHMKESESRVENSGMTRISVAAVQLDETMIDGTIDLLKIDVEGAEERVLRGAKHLLKDRKRAPRVIILEVHPYAWESFGSRSDTLLGLLMEHGYACTDPSGRPISHIECWGWVVATRSA